MLAIFSSFFPEKSFSFFMGFQNFYTRTLQPGLRFLLFIHIFGLYSPSRCWISSLFFSSNHNFSWGFHPLTLQPGLRFSLSMHISGLYSPNRCWIFFFFQSLFSMGFSSSHSPTRCRCWIFFFKPLFVMGFFILLILILSNQVLGSPSPCTYLVYTLQADIGFLNLYSFIDFSWGFDTLSIQPGFKFLLSMQMLLFALSNHMLAFSWEGGGGRIIFHEVSSFSYSHSPTKF